MPRIKNIFFDLDHTIWDFEKNSALTFKKILNEYRLNVNIYDKMLFFVENVYIATHNFNQNLNEKLYNFYCNGILFFIYLFSFRAAMCV